MKKSIGEIKDTDTVKTLSAGKSAVQNEVVGDLAAEFSSGGSLDNPSETSISDMASKLSGGYTKLGKISASLITKGLAGKLPGDFNSSAARSYLQGKGFGPNRIESILLHAVCVKMPAQRIGNADEAKKWLDSSVSEYCSSENISIPSSSAAAASTFNNASSQFFSNAPASFTPVADAPPSAKHSIQMILVNKMKKNLSEIKDSDTIKTLSAGKSAVQNEVVGDLAAEFAGAGTIDNPSETSISEMASKVASGYLKLGKITNSIVTKTLAAKLPGDFPASSVRSYLSGEKYLPPQRLESVILHACGKKVK